MTESREYAGMLYALADEIRAAEGCVTQSAERVEAAALRIDEQTIALNILMRQRDRLLAALLLVKAAYDAQPENIRTGNVCLIGKMDLILEAIAEAQR